MDKTKVFRKLTAFLLAVGTLASNIQLPVVTAEESSAGNSTTIGTVIPDNAIAVDVHGSGTVVVEQEGKETEVSSLTMFYGENGDQITIKASETDLPMTGFAVYTTDKEAFSANPDCEPEASYTATIGKDKYANIVFEEVNYDNAINEAYTSNDINSLPSSGSGQLWATSITGDQFGDQFQLQWINGALAPFTDEIKGVLGQCSNPGWLSWYDGNPYGVDSLDYSFSSTRRDGYVYLDITVAPDETHTGYSEIDHVWQRVGYQGIEWRSLALRLPLKSVNVSVVKNSANKPVTDNNPNYSLEGAVYSVSTASNMSSPVGTITTDKYGNGSTGTMELDSSITTLYAQETKPSKGYCLDPQVYTVTLDSNGKGSFTSTEPVGNDPLTITLNKVSENGDIIPAGEEPKSLEGAEFTVKYYAVDTTTVNTTDDVANVTPTKTWVLKTVKSADGKYTARLDDAHKVKGDSFYTYVDPGLGQRVSYLPLGVMTVEETKAPEGYTLENKITVEATGDQVTTAANGIALFKIDGSDGNYQVQGGNYFTATEKPIYGALNITKKDSQLGAEAQGDAPNLSATFEVVNDTEDTKTMIAPDGNRYTAAPHAAFEYKIHTDDAGNFQSPAEFLEYGEYTVSEIEAPEGYEGTSVTRKVAINNEGDSISIEYANDINRGTFSVQKLNAETGSRANGATDLQISFDVYNRSTHAVVVNGNTFAPGEKCYSDTTTGAGKWQGAENLLPYGTYEVKETAWHKGMTPVTQSQMIQIRESGVSLSVDIVNGDKPYTAQVHKITDFNSSGSSYSKPEEGAVYGIVLTSEVTKYGSVSAVLAHQYDTDIKNLTDRDWLNANIFTDGKLVSDNINKDGADLTKMSGREYGLMKTDADGNASITDFVYGSYTMVQLCSPNDEISVEKSSIKFDLNDENPVQKVEASNVAEKYFFRIMKKDSTTGQTITLNSATFKVYQMVDGEKKYITQKVGSKTYDTFRATSKNGSGEAGVFYVADDDEGTVTLPLEVTAGEYWVEEVNAPEGFEKSDDIKVTIKKGNITSVDDDGNQYITTTVNDKPVTGTLKINKEILNDNYDTTFVDENTITQIEFSLIANEDIINPDDGSVLTAKGEVANDIRGNKIGVMHLNANGQATLRGIPLGKYTLVETYIPTSLQVNAEKRDVVITADKPVLDTYNIENKPTEVSISKKAVTGDDELEGATLQVIDRNNNVVDEWVSTSEQHIITGLTRNATYTLRETITPENGTYVKANDIKFTVKEDGTTDTVKMIDKLVDVSKVDVAGEEVVGAKMQVTDRAGNVIDEWISGNETHYVKNLVVGGTYIIHEEVVADGYVKATDIPFTVTDEAVNQHYDVVDKVVTVSKIDMGGEEISGASMSVTDEAGNVVDQWTSDGTEHHIKNLEEGKSYVLHEDLAPTGYVKATDIPFTVDGADEDGVKVDQHIDMTDKKVTINKTDGNGNEVENAKIIITDENGDVVDQWTSDGTTHDVENLEVGKTYTWHEEYNEDIFGYYYAEDYTFTVTDDGIDQNLEMVDSPIKYQIVKVDENGDNVKGVTLTLTDITDENNPKEIELPNDGVTTGEPFDIGTLVQANKTYKLVESEYINGLYKATDMTFTVPLYGTSEVTKITMEDDFTNVAVNKIDNYGNPVVGATLQVFEAVPVEEATRPDPEETVDPDFGAEDEAIGLAEGMDDDNQATRPEGDIDPEFSLDDGNQATKPEGDIDPDFGQDADPTVNADRYTTINGVTYYLGNPVCEFTTDGSYKDISSYVKGSNEASGDVMYVLRESKTPFGYKTMNDIAFKVTGTTNQKQIITGIDERLHYFVSAVKVDAQDNSKKLKGAEITLFRPDGTVAKDVNGKECKGLTDGKGNIVWEVEYNDNMENGGYYVQETAAPQGYRINSNKYNVTLSEDYDFASNNPVVIVVNDEALPTTVQTGIQTGIFMFGGLFAVTAALLFFLLKARKNC